MDQLLQYTSITGITIIRYFLSAGIPFLIFYILFPNSFVKNKIQSKIAKNKDFLREIAHSMQTSLIIAGVALLFLFTPLKAYTQIYEHLDAYSIWWLPLSILLGLIVHDTYFYWMHRTLHHPSIFRYTHLVHHKSINPSPWASYSFHMIEGFTEALILPIILLLIPMHPIALLIFGLGSLVINVYGHLGFEITPKWFRNSFLFEVFNTSVYHNVHHSKFEGNYSLYFRFWDRVMKTEHPDYVKIYDEIQAKRFGQTSTSLAKKISLPLILLFGLSTFSGYSQSAIEGKWKDSVDGGIILIYEEEGQYFGQLIAAVDPIENEKLKGKTIIVLKDFEKTNDAELCCGTIYQVREKRTVSGNLILLDQNNLKVKGRYGWFTGSRIWTRV